MRLHIKPALGAFLLAKLHPEHVQCFKRNMLEKIRTAGPGMTGIGTPLEARNVERAFAQIVKAAQLPRVRIHDLRHTAATLLLAKGVHPRVVMELLGHSQIAVTMNTYSHVVPAALEECGRSDGSDLEPHAASG